MPLKQRNQTIRILKTMCKLFVLDRNTWYHITVQTNDYRWILKEFLKSFSSPFHCSKQSRGFHKILSFILNAVLESHMTLKCITRNIELHVTLKTVNGYKTKCNEHWKYKYYNQTFTLNNPWVVDMPLKKNQKKTQTWQFKRLEVGFCLLN